MLLSSYSKFCFFWPLPTFIFSMKPKNLIEPQLFLLDVEIKCFHEVEFLTISVSSGS